MRHTHPESDETTLAEFVVRRDEKAFAALVERYADMVYGTALRKCGSVEIAEEACQNVFVLLARKAGRIRSANALGVWLHRAALLESRQLLRKESNHLRKMKRYADDLESQTQSEAPEWNPMLPLLDDLIDKLSESDRRMIVWRFFEGRTFKEIGARLGKSDDTCQKRTSRALEKLGRSLKQLGIALPVTAIAAGLTAQTSKTASCALKSMLTNSAMLASPLGSESTTIPVLIMNQTNWKLTAALAVALAVPLGLQWSQNRSLAARIESAEGASAKRVTESVLSIVSQSREPRTHLTPSPSREETALQRLRDALSKAESAPHRRSALALVNREIAALPKEAIGKAYAMLSSSPLMASRGHPASAIVMVLFDRWGTEDPHTALKAAFQRHYEPHLAIRAAYAAWARVEPGNALTNLAEDRAGMRHRDWMATAEQVFRSLALHSPAEAAREVVAFEAPVHEQDNLIACVAGYWADSDPDTALQWVDQFPGDSRQRMALTVAIHTIVKTDPKRAAELALGLPDGEKRNRLLSTIQQQWEKIKPDDSEAWFEFHGLSQIEVK